MYLKNKCRLSGLIAGLLLVGMVFSVTVPVYAEEAESIKALRSMGKAFASIAEKASPAVVSVVAYKVPERSSRNQPSQSPFFDDELFERFFGPRFRIPRNPGGNQPTETASGSGFIISKEGYILTNNHVVSDAKDNKITVTLKDGRELEAKVIGTDPDSDVAVAKIESNETFAYIELADSDALEVGEWVVAIGNAFGLSHTVTAGIVSAKGRNSLYQLQDISFQDFIQTDAAINPGNSGGPLLNLDGKAVGMNTAILGPGGANAGIGFAIPINMAKSVSTQLIETGTVVRGFLGIEMNALTEDLAKSLELEDARGALVVAVGEGTPAEKAGLKRYDVIVELNGKIIDSMQRLQSEVAQLPPETRVKLVIIRNGRRKTLDVVLGERSDKALNKLQGISEILSDLGLEVMNLTPEMRERLQNEGLKGVLITQVQPGSEADRKGLRRYMLITEVNREPVSNVKELNESVQKAVDNNKETILLYVTDGSRDGMVSLKLPKK